MHIAEMDWRYSWIRQALAALDQGLDDLEATHDDGLDLLEDAEGLVGLGFVAIQGYVRGASCDLARVFPNCPDMAALMGTCSAVVEGAGLTQIEAIWAVANYFKHHDEWIAWETDARPGTRTALAKLGVSKGTAFPCVDVSTRLQGETWRLVPMLELARSWRESWFARMHQQAA